MQEIEPSSSSLQRASTFDSLNSEPLPSRKTEEIYVLELLGLYDRVSFARLVDEGFAFSVDIKSEVDALLSSCSLKSLNERISSVGEDDILHFVLSNEWKFAALVLKNATIEIWKRDVSKRDWVQHHSFQLASFQLDANLGDSVGTFFVGEDGQPEFIFLNPEPAGVVARSMDLETGRISSYVLPLATRGQSLKTLKIAENARRAFAVFEDRTFTVFRLDDRDLSIGITGRFHYPCVFDNFVKDHVQRSYIHISEDCRRLTTGWDTTKERLITFTLDSCVGAMHDEYVSNCGNLKRSDFGFVSWMNEGGGRAIVHRKTGGQAQFLFHSPSASLGSGLHEMHRSVLRPPSGEAQACLSSFNFKDPIELRLSKMCMLLSLQASFPEYQMLHLLGVTLDEKIVRRFLHKFHLNAVNYRDPDGRTLLHYAVMQEQIACARLLFSVAGENGVPVQLSWNGGDVLGWAIEKGSYQMLALILERIATRCTSPAETANLLSIHFATLLAKYPHLVDDYMINDKFCFEYGRFSVPMHVFEEAGDRPIAMVTDFMDDWNASSDDAAKFFWTQNTAPDLAQKINDKSGRQVTAVSKFICMDNVGCPDKSNVFPHLGSSGLSLEAFNSSFIRTLVQWMWHTSLKFELMASGLLHLLAALSFTLFAEEYGTFCDDYDDRSFAHRRLNRSYCLYIHHEEPNASERALYRWKIGVACILLWTITLFGRKPFSKLVSALLHVPILAILVLEFTEHTGNEVVAALISLYCIVLWIKVFLYLQPFETIGPMVSTVRRVIWDTVPFLTLACMAIMGFGMAFLVLFGYVTSTETLDLGQETERILETRENSVNYTVRYIDEPRSFDESADALVFIFSLILGEFNHEFLSAVMEGGVFISAWISILYLIALFFGSFVLLSLLVAILGDTYNKVRMREKEELIRCRARLLSIRDDWRLAKAFMNNLENAFSFLKPKKRTTSQAGSRMPCERMKCFHVLVPAEPKTESKDDFWSRRILDTVKKIETNVKEREHKSEKESKDLNGSVFQMQREMVMQRRKIEQVENSVSLILHLLTNSESQQEQQ